MVGVRRVVGWVRLAARAAGLTYLAIAVFERVAPRPAVRAYQRATNRFYEPLMGVLPGWAVLETIGRRSGAPRRVPVGVRRTGDTIWLVAGDRSSAFVHNIGVNPCVRVRHRGRWHDGIATLLEEDGARGRVLRVNPLNGMFVALANPPANMLTVRINLVSPDA